MITKQYFWNKIMHLPNDIFIIYNIKTNKHFITDLVGNDIFINNGKLYESINLYRKPFNDFLIKTYLQHSQENV